MTLCIGAIALQHGPPLSEGSGWAAILAFDRREETPYVGSTDNAFKYWGLSHNWRMLYASDDTGKARELIGRFRSYFKAHELEITPENAIDHLYEPVLEQIAACADRLKRQSAGMWDITEAQAALTVKDQFIAVGCMDGRFFLYRFVDGEWSEEDFFAAIGSGWYVAQAIFYAREAEGNSIRFVPEMIYRVNEALRFGCGVPGVSQNASLHLLTFENDRLRERAVQTDDKLQELWSRFGLRRIAKDFSEKDFDWYEPRRDDETSRLQDIEGG